VSAGESGEAQLACPLPFQHDTVQMAHGGGGRLTRELIEGIFLPAFAGDSLRERHDAALLARVEGRLAVTTDGYVIRPRFFPGGDIGSLAVYGTVNDLAMAGARPLYMTVSFILEEGLPLDELRRIVQSAAGAARVAGVEIVAGDTKVVDRGAGDGVYLATTGIGVIQDGVDVRPSRIRVGDAVLVSGDLGRHGIAVLSRREGLEFEIPIESDCAPLHGLVARLLGAGVDVHCLRDLTRGGLASALNELALDAGVDIEIDETRVPVSDAVRAACELLGLDPYYVANEGRFVAFLPPSQVDAALAVMRGAGAAAAQIGRVELRASAKPRVLLRGPLGSRRPLDLLSGEQLPRIC
jgi:hydrogenase expression/formation protein HypE